VSLQAMLSTLLASALAAAPEKVLLTMRTSLAKDDLAAAISAGKTALQSCSADKASEAPLHRVLNASVHGLERKQQLLSATPKPMPKLEKALKSAGKKLKAVKDEFDGEELLSKDDKATIAKAEAAERAARLAIDEAKVVERVKAGRGMSALPFSSLLASLRAGPHAGRLTVLSEGPLVVTVDDFLGAAGKEALADLPAVLDSLAHEEEGSPQLCLGDAPDKAVTKKVEEAIKEAKKAASKGKAHCNATAALVSIAANYSEAGGGGPPGSAPDSGCGPLTPALDAVLTQRDAAWMIIGANKATDLLDAAISGVVGFTAQDAEAAFAQVEERMVERDDPATVEVPPEWDEEEDGEWEPSKLPGESYEAALAKVVQLSAADASPPGLGLAYAYSSSPEILRYRAATGGGRKLALECDDFASESPVSAVLGAHLYATTVPKGKGGEDTFPALGVSVRPEAGRLLLFEVAMPDGGCDPASAAASAPLKPGGADKLLLSKRFYSAPAFDRGANNAETPQQPPRKVLCDAENGCQRREPAGRPQQGAAVQAAHSYKAPPQ